LGGAAEKLTVRKKASKRQVDDRSAGPGQKDAAKQMKADARGGLAAVGLDEGYLAWLQQLEL
jgi:hypothetical protein